MKSRGLLVVPVVMLLVVMATIQFATTARLNGGEVWSPPEDPDLQTILNEAHIDTQAGRYKDALAKHVWFHEHALAIDPAFSAVRLSFAISYWYELARCYPPALEKLKEFRNIAEKNVLAGKDIFSSFQEMTCIDKQLGNEAATRQVFEILDQKNPEGARQVLILAEPALIRAKAYPLVGKYISPKDDFARMEQIFSHNKDEATNRRLSSSNLEFNTKSFVNNSTTLVAILAVNQRKEEAADIAASARASWDDKSFHAALDKALKGIVPDPWP